MCPHTEATEAVVTIQEAVLAIEDCRNVACRLEMLHVLEELHDAESIACWLRSVA
jgi:hypothetical protein